MNRGKNRTTAVASNCFRLLRLTHELQNDGRVMKTVVDEVDVLRLCRSLGMAVSMKVGSTSAREFEFGLFDPSDYDADFARFLREKVFGGSGSQQEELEGDQDLLQIGCLFGKQSEVKAELARMEFWSAELNNNLSLEDQGVYCAERGASTDGRRQFLAFVWLNATLFEPDVIRDTPAYMLRFLISLSPSVTCCLSREDFRCIENEVQAASSSAGKRWNSYSVAFSVKKQEKQSDNICCGPPVTASLPQRPDQVKGVVFTGGVFPAIAVESVVPSMTEWFRRQEVLDTSALADWIAAKHAEFKVLLTCEQLRSEELRDELLAKFDLLPNAKLQDLREQKREELKQAKLQSDRATDESTQEICDALTRDADLLFAVREPGASAMMDSAQSRCVAILQSLSDQGVLCQLDDYTQAVFNLPERLQEHMEEFENAFKTSTPVFEEALGAIVTGIPVRFATRGRSGEDKSFLSIVTGAAIWRRLWRDKNGPFGSRFRSAMAPHLICLQIRWVNTVLSTMPIVHDIMRKERVRRCEEELDSHFRQAEMDVKDEAFGGLHKLLANAPDRRFRAEVDIRWGADANDLCLQWIEEVEKEPSKVVRVWQIQSSTPVQLSLLGKLEFEPGSEVLQYAAVKICQLVAVLVKDEKTIVYRLTFPVRSEHAEHLKAEQSEVRTFPKRCSLCSIRAQGRQVAFAFGSTSELLGGVAIFRFNESFSSMECTRRVDLSATFRLAAPLVDIRLTERCLYAMDSKGELQSFDTRTRQTSKRVSLGDCSSNAKSQWTKSLLCFGDELVIGRAGVKEEGGAYQVFVDCISREDHRKLPTVSLGVDLASKELGVACMGDVLYVFEATSGQLYASELNVTVRSDSFRIQRSGKGVRNGRPGCLRVNEKDDKGETEEHWLWVLFHVFEKFPIRSLMDATITSDDSSDVQLIIAVDPAADASDSLIEAEMTATCEDYFSKVMAELGRLNKPLAGLDLTKGLRCLGYEQRDAAVGLRPRPIGSILAAIVSFAPVQICRAEDNTLKLLQSGEDNQGRATEESEGDASTRTDAAGIATSIRFGLLSPLLESWGRACVVITSMGKQSTGKSYFLNHLTGSSFAISGSRCTDGAWMSVRVLSSDVLVVVLDFEGLGSFERSEQEDIFLSVLNASVSVLTIFRMESRFDKDLDALFSRFQKGVQLIKNDPQLFRGLLYMSVKDVNVNDQQGVVDELVTKLGGIFDANKDQNFLVDMYSGQLEINCSPPLGTTEYYRSLEHAAKTLRDILAPGGEAARGFPTGKAFLDCLRIVLAKISILDWTNMDKSTQKLLVADVKQRLPGILRTGCHVSMAVVSDTTIPPHLKEEVIRVGTRAKVVISLSELCVEYPAFAAQWLALNEHVLMDSIADETVDFGFEVTSLENKNVAAIQKTLVALFGRYLSLRDKAIGNAKLTVEDQSEFDTLLSFVLQRRKMKISWWLRDMLNDRLPEVCGQLEQRMTAVRTTCVEALVNTPIVAAKQIWKKFRRALAMQVTKGSASATLENTRADCRVFTEAPNCDQHCSERAGHSGDHKCSVQLHTCGAPCSAAMCSASCMLAFQREHTVHKCVEIQCLHPCLMDGCEAHCGVKDHFHGQATESRVFAEESGAVQPLDANSVASDSDDPMEAATHMCLGTHSCGALCGVDGICEQKVHLKKSSRTYQGVRGSFEYVFQEMNGQKKPCAHVLPSGKRDHEGAGHFCIVECGEEAEETMHYCAARCPCCDYYCSKDFGHMELHKTSHGNMRQTVFMAKSSDIDLEGRRYQVGERGTAEMCNLYCSKMGRGHIHYLKCDQGTAGTCVYTGDASQDQRRHCTDELYPPPGKAMDELLHAQFWSTIGWEDPCVSEEEREVFAKCPYQCNAAEHEEGPDKRPSYCVLNVWHPPAVKPGLGDDGFAYVNGHKFECVHATDSGKFHHIFVLDNSGSMSGQPWQDLLCACNDFLMSRLKDGGERDLISYVTFNHESDIQYEAESLLNAQQLILPPPDGGTSFAEGLCAASEVLSRNDFEEFKAVLIFFSDGHPWDIGDGIALAKHIRTNYAKFDLKAFVVGFGHVNLAVLNRVAGELGGEYRHVLDACELRNEFQRIAATLGGNQASLMFVEEKADQA
ncbi:hypothetical protein BBJ28_00018850 [Nothophytophthora sp. Chile5]|nr:hypothetical protein BBJ28_00018850 [Nothophytophthora sp. Chile5]